MGVGGDGGGDPVAAVSANHGRVIREAIPVYKYTVLQICANLQGSDS